MANFLLFTFVLVLLGILVRVFWVQLLAVGLVLSIILGIIVSAAFTALCFQFFSLMTSNLNDAGSFHTYFIYSLIFFTAAMIVYVCIVSDIIGIGIDFIHNLFRK